MDACEECNSPVQTPSHLLCPRCTALYQLPQSLWPALRFIRALVEAGRIGEQLPAGVA